MRHLSIDIETYSSVALPKAGLYKYAQSPDFEILLIACAADGGPVEVIDLTQEPGGQIPAPLIGLLRDPDVLKHAYNAAFEWYCLSRWLGMDDAAQAAWLPQWRCTMLHALYCGYPAGLAAAGEALGLPQDRRKLATGSALIRTFCAPVKPSKSNGGRTRTLPQHEPDKWRLMAEYNRQDVVTEMEIERRLAAHPVPDAVQHQWEQDLRVNLHGALVDRVLVEAAVEIDETTRGSLTAEAERLTGLANPNSRDQLLRWLTEETGEALTDVRKGTVQELIRRLAPGDARRVLEIRQALSKTSIAKYQAMRDCVCEDGRIRGLLQFYGANRTGRWAGRLVQTQNLPQTHLEALPLARQLVKDRKTETLSLIYGNVAGTLSQLLRTAFIAPAGKLLISADFSAIEARVIAWLAGEQWRMDVFGTHGKIYEASASQMFGVPVEYIVKGRPEYALRQKGKIAELALGYQGSVGALRQMGALQMGLTEDELPEIVRRWREANRAIVAMWHAVEAAAIGTVQTGIPAASHRCLFALEGDAGDYLYLTVRLPSGRKLYYAAPQLGVNRWGQPSLTYMGASQATRRWERIETYGGRLTENIVQATARDCLAVALERVEAMGYPICFHVHDELIVEAPEATADEDLDQICAAMCDAIPWAPGLLLKANGYISPYYKKD